MHECHNCSKTMLFGGRTIEGYRYCGNACASRHPLLRSAERIPANVLQQHVEHWRNGPCPRCKQQQGPIDVYAHHRVHSFILMTQWSTKKHICCRRCGRREQIKSALYSASLGWWGIPWGLLATPIQVTRNVAGIFQREPMRASADFEQVVRMQLAQQIQQAEQPAASFSAQR
ncbi:hypothetical protein [Dyella silvatica]|uniref:hypothetical protein n=1 Tax=Dyella silvatica TaxID=2992128 RepID=UPI00224F64F6|nr:hypothetical protein [Dyella silvatica]